jgi:hypothetical protein
MRLPGWDRSNLALLSYLRHIPIEINEGAGVCSFSQLHFGFSRTFLVRGRNFFGFLVGPFLSIEGSTWNPKKGFTWNQKGFSPEPKSFLLWGQWKNSFVRVQCRREGETL